MYKCLLTAKFMMIIKTFGKSTMRECLTAQFVVAVLMIIKIYYIC